MRPSRPRRERARTASVHRNVRLLAGAAREAAAKPDRPQEPEVRDPAPTAILLKDYAPPAFLVDTIDLDIAIFDDHARVRARLAARRNPAARDPRAPLVLDGDELALVSVALDGRALTGAEYAASPDRLTIHAVPDAFTLATEVRIEPQKNTKLMGLYASKDGYFTQSEAEGFRRITYFIDRPDVMARYTCTIRADRERCPHLLSNGNPVAAGFEPPRPAAQGTPPFQGGDQTTPTASRPPLLEKEGTGRHWVRWEDPFPKPSYLFAVVAAKLDRLEDDFVTMSGKRAKLGIYVEPGRLEEARFAMDALKRAMKWDEETFGLELDLDHYMIVAVGDFNMGAMENKGLNIFNTKYVLARPDTATDVDYQNIDRVVAHEYFHNWTGNRVTCRDWFQLSLKEGLTVFRDQEFGADMHSRAVSRIREVRNLRLTQFPEDAGPMAHPVRPQSYIEVTNFYTATVYEKGAEVVRMISTLVGKAAFRRGMDLYFERHDGRAVTCDDFVRAMADAAGVDLGQFMRWYDQAGTPVVEARGEYDAATRRYTLELAQSCPPTPGQPTKLPFHIPVAVGLVGPDGRDVPLRLEGEAAPSGTTRVLSLRTARERYAFVDVPAAAVPSLLRDFSAPVILKHDYDASALAHLMAHDSDPFNRWEAGQRLATGLLLEGVAAQQAARATAIPESFVAAFARVLADAPRDPAFAAEALTLPSEIFLAEQLDVVDPDAIHAARNALAAHLARALRRELAAAYRANVVEGAYRPDAASAGKRALRNLCLAYLMELADDEARALAMAQFEGGDNMTDGMAALAAFANCDCPERGAALDAFYARWKEEPLVVDKWLRVQAVSRLPGTLAEVKRLLVHPAFSLRNPNKVYALVGGFALANHVRFHAADGAGYAFLADQVIALDRLNPQVAARMARAFDRWRKFDAGRQARARAALERVRDAEGLSKDTTEVVVKS
ncbi:MAG: aminopeptidase N, partial [Burkholderiales bacterium]|nr:aminopeptidase N [Burkholderiales bacterium]